MTDTEDRHGKEMAQRVGRGIDLEDWDDLAKLIREEVQRHVDAKCATLRAERDRMAAKCAEYEQGLHVVAGRAEHTIGIGTRDGLYYRALIFIRDRACAALSSTQGDGDV